MKCLCHIVPASVLERLSRDEGLEPEYRRHLAVSAVLISNGFDLRAHQVERTRLLTSLLGPTVPTLAGPGLAMASITVSDCGNGTTLPSTPVADPVNAADATARNAAVEAQAVYDFYNTAFARNSIDNAGMTIASSVHYSTGYNNALWNGTQMVYGDGDGRLFIDFTKGNDVIGHELTHGVTQHSLQLSYVNEAGGLNESLSDAFGSMFRQYQAGQDVTAADWLIGKDILGPAALARGFTCLRDMSDPAGVHCLAPQSAQYSQYHDGMDPHESSGIPNLAFYKAAMAIGGKSWEKTGKIWYAAQTQSGSQPSMTMGQFANATRNLAATLFPADASVARAVDTAWGAVGL
jgi:Zn-dependent metalloprotease